MSRFQFDTPSPRVPFSKDGELWYPADIEGVPGRVLLRLGRSVDGAYVCTGLAVDAPDAAITTGALKNIHIAQLLEQLLKGLEPGGDPAWVHAPDPSAHGGSVVWDLTPTIPAERPTRGGRGPTPENLALFAQTYRDALNSPSKRRRPVEATAAALNVGVSTAHRWKALCQERGLLAKKGEGR